MTYIISNAIKPANKKYSIIIPAAGIGRRMKSCGPKCCVNIKENFNIIDNQIKYIQQALKRHEIILVVGDRFEKIKQKYQKRNLKVVFNQDYQTTNVVTSIKEGLKHVSNKNVIIIYGDLVFNAYALKAPFGTESMLIFDKSGLMDKDEVGMVIVNNQVQNMMYDLPDKWAQIMYLQDKELDIFTNLSNNSDYRNYFGFELINMTINQGGKFRSYSPPRMKITDIDSFKDIDKVPLII